MEQLSAEHLAWLGVTVALCAALVAASWRHSGAPWVEPLARGLAVALVVNHIAYWAIEAANGRLDTRTDLPVDLSEVAVGVAVAALWWRWRLAAELTYFWAFSATVQAALTPSQAQGFPDHRWWFFVIAHSGVLLAATLLVAARRQWPQPGALRRVVVATLAVTGVAALADVAFDANYMFLRRPPPAGSLLDLMGPWPWYVLAASGLAIALFWLLDLPFRRARRIRAV